VSGPADLHTVLGRSVLLQLRVGPDGPVVDRVLIGAGELLADLPPDLEQDAIMNHRGKGDRLFQAEPDRALWRDAHALYAAALSGSGRLYNRLALLDQEVNLLAVGLIADQSKVSGWVRDVFPFRGTVRQELHLAAYDGASCAEDLTSAVTKAAETARANYYRHSSVADTQAWGRLLRRFDPGGELWSRLDTPFHLLLNQVVAGGPPEPALDGYCASLIAAGRHALAESLACLPPNNQGLRARAMAEAELDRQLKRKQVHPRLAKAAR